MSGSQDNSQLYEKLNAVDRSVSEVRSSVGTVQTILEYMKETFERLERSIDSQDRLLYGKDGTHDVSLLARLTTIELTVGNAERSRRFMSGWLWTAVGALTIELVLRFFAVLPVK